MWVFLVFKKIKVLIIEGVVLGLLELFFCINCRVVDGKIIS